jgi:hypothetical protein
MGGILKTGTGRKSQRILAIGLGVGAAVGLTVVAAIHVATLPKASANKAYWTVSGPPCPTTTEAAQAMGRPLAQVVDFGEGRFARSSGAILCNDTTDVLGLVTGTICQFDAPRRLAVWSKGGAAFFDVPNGGPATVTASPRRPPRCVMGAHYAGD